MSWNPLHFDPAIPSAIQGLFGSSQKSAASHQSYLLQRQDALLNSLFSAGLSQQNCYSQAQYMARNSEVMTALGLIQRQADANFGALSGLRAFVREAYSTPVTVKPPTEREIAALELRTYLGEELWGFSYMDGLKRDVADLRA